MEASNLVRYEIIVDTLEMLVIAVGLVGAAFGAFRIAHKIGIFHGEAMSEMRHIADETKLTRQEMTRFSAENSEQHRRIFYTTGELQQRVAKLEGKTENDGS